MFEQIQIANRGDQLPLGSPAAQPNPPAARPGRGDGYTAEATHV